MPDVGAAQPVPYQPAAGVTGSGEELALTLEKVVSQLDIISRTLHVLEQRVSMNEESVSSCLQYFKEAREARQTAAASPLMQQTSDYEARLMGAQLQSQQQMRYDLEQLKDMTDGVSAGIQQTLGGPAAQE